MDEWPAWRLILQSVATLKELDGSDAVYSFNDIMKLNAWLDYKADFESKVLDDSSGTRNKTRV